MVHYISDEEFQQLKALLSQLETRKQLERGKAEESTNDEKNDDEGVENIGLFDEIDNAIITLVEKKKQEGQEDSGPNQTQIVGEVQKNYGTAHGTSRVSVLKRIENLVRYKVLIERPDPKNRQTKRYHVDKENLLLQIHRYFDNLKEALINLIKSFIEKNGGPVTGQKVEEVIFFWVIFEIYQHVRAITMTHATFNWPRVTNDPVLLNKLYRALFARLIQLQESLSKALEVANVDIYRNFFLSSWRLRPEVIDEGLAIAQKYDLPNERVSRVFNLAWSIGAPVVEYARIKFEKDDASHAGVDEMTNDNNAKIEKWRSSGGWKDAYLYWKGQDQV